MDEVLQMLLDTSKTLEGVKDFTGRRPALTLAVVTEREDPQELGRVRCRLPNKDNDTNWLFRAEPCPNLSLPVPNLGDTVWVGFRDGDPHKGFYIGVCQNNINPAYDIDSMKFTIGEVIITVHPEDIQVELGSFNSIIEPESARIELGSLNIEIDSSGNVSFEGVNSFHINDAANQVATIGARDNDTEGNSTDRLVTRGW